MPDGSVFFTSAPPKTPVMDPPRKKRRRPDRPLKLGVAWAEEGMLVWLPWNREKRSALCCNVAVAAGHHARIVNETYGVNKWVRLDDLLIEEGDPHGYPTVMPEF